MWRQLHTCRKKRTKWEQKHKYSTEKWNKYLKTLFLLTKCKAKFLNKYSHSSGIFSHRFAYIYIKPNSWRANVKLILIIVPLKWKNLLRGNCGNLEPWNAFFFQMSFFLNCLFFRYSYKPNILRWVLGKLISTSVHSDESWRLPSLDGTAHTSAVGPSVTSVQWDQKVWPKVQNILQFRICLSVNFQPLQHFIPFCHLQFSFFMFPSLCW